MTAVMQRHVASISWWGISILCVAVCIQLLGVPGTLFDITDSEDDFRTSVTTGYSITTSPLSPFASLMSFVGFRDIASLQISSPFYNFFHPPLYAQTA